MIQKNGHIIAIDSVVHDNTLSGNGTIDSPLTVIGGLKNIGAWATVTGKYVGGNFTYGKDSGTIKFQNGLVLSGEGVYEVTTDVYFKPAGATPNWYDMNINVGGQIYNFSVDGTNNGTQTYSFTQMENCTTNKTLSTSVNFDNIGSAYMVQSVHNIVSMNSVNGPSPTPVGFSTIPFELEDLDTDTTSTYNMLYQDGE